MGVWVSRRLRLRLAGHRRRRSRVRRQPQRNRVRARCENRLPGLGIRGRCRRSIESGRRGSGGTAPGSSSGMPTRRFMRSTPRPACCAGRSRSDDHGDAMITGAVAFHDGRLYAGCRRSRRGRPSSRRTSAARSAAASSRSTQRAARQLWKTFTLSDAPRPTTRNSAGTQLWGPSGGGVWSTPALDPDATACTSRRATTTPIPSPGTATRSWRSPSTPGAFCGRSKRLRATRGTSAASRSGGAGRVKCPDGAGPDHDFGSSPVLTTLADGRRVLLAGQKSGMLHALNPDTGRVSLADARRRGRHARRHRVGLCHRRTDGLRLAVERVREESGRGRRPRRDQYRRRQAAWSRASSGSRYVRRPDGLQHGPAGRCHARFRASCSPAASTVISAATRPKPAR